MTDHDRGAYTPQPDAPLQFDARGPRGRKPMPMTLIGSGAVLVVLLGALALHYRQHSSATGEGARPVGTPVAQMKTAAPATAQPKPDASGAVDVFNGGVAKNEAKAPTFAPAPEAPKPRAQLHVLADDGVVVKSTPMTTTNTTSVATAPVKSAPAKPVVLAPATTTVAKVAPIYHAPTPASVAAAKPDATSIVAKVAAGSVTKTTATTKPATTTLATAKVATPASAKTVAAATTTAKTAASGSVVQIGAFSSAELSTKGFTDVSSSMSGQMTGKAKRVEAVEKDGKTFYRTSVTGFSTRAAAEAFCKSLAAKGHACFAKG